MGSKKRKIDLIDLTDDTEDVNSLIAAQRKKSNTPHPSRPSSRYSSSASASPYPTPPTSSQPSLSQSGSQNHPDLYRRNVPSPSLLFDDTPKVYNGGVQISTQAIEEDVRGEIDLTQDPDDDLYENYENYEIYGVLNSKVVGIRYYNGRATAGEYVTVRREPGNQYDRNAIRIDNVMGCQIGHIGRDVAAKLAPLIDSKALLVEAQLIGEKRTFDCPIALKLFGPTDPVEAAALKQRMQALRLPVGDHTRAEQERKRKAKAMDQQRKARDKAAAALQKNGGVVWETEGPARYSNFNMPGSSTNLLSPSLEDVLSGTASYNPRDVQDVIKKFGVGEDILSQMEMAEQPATIATPLLPYQRQGLKWILDHEFPELPKNGSDDVVQLWKNERGIYRNIATSFSVNKAPELASGGILADDMGLGKTIQIISLIMTDPHRSGLPTLIVAPLSVMSNWSSQASAHVKKKHAPRVLIYHGQETRSLSPGQLREYDMVITTYQTMTSELFPLGKKEPLPLPTTAGLFSLTWRRVVLDEGHQIRNPKAKMSRAACALMTQCRWILTGTPIVNSLKDLFSHVKFLRLSGGLAEFEIFNGTLIRPLKNGDGQARLLLQALMSTICLRRMKDMKFVDLRLPKLDFHKYLIKFLPHEQERYDAFKAEAKGLVEAAKVKKGENTMTHLLEVLLRLRQTCNHWKMCGEDRVNKLLELVEANKAVDTLDPENRRTLQDLLQLRIDSQEDCPVCMETISNPVITACTHAFCQECIQRVIETQHKCPMCRGELADNGTLVLPVAGLGEGDVEVGIDMDVDNTSSKIESLVSILRASSQDDHVKTVVFSQWTSFLDLIQAQLPQHDLAFTRLDGKMSAVQRDAAIEALNSDPSCKIMLASLSVCSVGLNLVAANQVILSDSWWAPAIEDQAVDRVHRLGQTRDCKVVRLVVEDTIEDEVLQIQSRKRKLAATAFGEKDGSRKRGEERGERLRDIERLLR